MGGVAAVDATPAVGMCGFTADECALLMLHGARPWDEDADEVLRGLRSQGGGGGTLV